jgi:hypothetical protein
LGRQIVRGRARASWRGAARDGCSTPRGPAPGRLRRPSANSLKLVLLQTPPAVVRQLGADENAVQTATGARFVAGARDRQFVIRTLVGNAKEAAAARLAPEERDDLNARRDLDELSAESPPPS